MTVAVAVAVAAVVVAVAVVVVAAAAVSVVFSYVGRIQTTARVGHQLQFWNSVCRQCYPPQCSQLLGYSRANELTTRHVMMT